MMCFEHAYSETITLGFFVFEITFTLVYSDMLR